MSSPKYMMITVAKCAPKRLGEAIGHLDGLCSDLKSGAGAITTRHGVIATGDQAGHIVLFQSYDELEGIDRAFAVYDSSDAYKGLVHDIEVSVSLRNILRIEDLGLSNPSTDKPGYGVVTGSGISADLQLDRMRAVVPHFEAGGAMILLYCTILTGPATGHRLVVAGYPSMGAIQKTYDNLGGSPEYKAVLEGFEIEWRNIIRVTG